jgi:hypothetical protein
VRLCRVEITDRPAARTNGGNHCFNSLDRRARMSRGSLNLRVRIVCYPASPLRGNWPVASGEMTRIDDMAKARCPLCPTGRAGIMSLAAASPGCDCAIPARSSPAPRNGRTGPPNHGPRAGKRELPTAGNGRRTGGCAGSLRAGGPSFSRFRAIILSHPPKGRPGPRGLRPGGRGTTAHPRYERDSEIPPAAKRTGEMTVLLVATCDQRSRT